MLLVDKFDTFCKNVSLSLYFPLKFLTCEEGRVGGWGGSKYSVGYEQGKQTAPVLKLNLKSSISTFMKYFKDVAATIT